MMEDIIPMSRMYIEAPIAIDNMVIQI